MATSTGPVIAIGVITVLNQTVLNDKPMNWRVPIATGAAAVFFAGLEKVSPEGANALAWMALGTIMLTRVNGVKSPTESFLDWWNKGQKG
jgi:hypothetical protein